MCPFCHKLGKGYITPAAYGIPTASERGAQPEVAHEWARSLHNPLPPRGSPPLQRGGKIINGPLLGKVAT